jgi:hypothetical protein
MYGGRIVKELLGDEISEENIMTYALGSPAAEAAGGPGEMGT